MKKIRIAFRDANRVDLYLEDIKSYVVNSDFVQLESVDGRAHYVSTGDILYLVEIKNEVKE